ncbi:MULTISPECIES: HK97-gp10 family putative phage morphogenesis protein [Massilia]|uniref:HK97-gp10 family putative phage morphogenesis protein n=1 Tax=Massilia haematophila TaxID=457923 RepID=A0ABV7PH53_9BURK|nr:HK97-gp10 family putative phage morphogenesis protein [Massilia sp.]
MRFDTSSLVEVAQQTADQVVESIDESVLRAVGYAGADLFRDQAKQNALANKKTGMLFDSIIVKRIEEESDGGKIQVYLVTVRKGSAVGDGAYYWRWVEKGHKFVPRNKNISPRTGRKVGWAAHRRAAELEYGNARVRAYPFMRPAYESRKNDAVDLMTRTLSEQLARNAT